MMLLLGCTGKNNQPENTDDNDTESGTVAVENPQVIDDEDEVLTLSINPAENDDADESEDIDEDTDEDNDVDYAVKGDDYDIYVVHEDGSVDLLTDDDKIINSADFTSSTEYVYIINDYVEENAEHGMYDIARSVPIYADGDYYYNVTKNITLPKEVDGAKIEWISSDESIISNEGVIVKRPHNHSKYVMLTAVITKGDSKLTSRYIVKVARDMYDDITEDMIMGLSDDYGNYELLEEKGITLSDYPGWFYWCDELEQLYFFQDDLDRIMLFDDPDNKINPRVSGVGNLFEVKVETLHEAYLAASSLRSVIYCDEKYELRFDGSFSGMGDDYYDFVQYYNGVKTDGMIRLLIDHEGECNSFNSWMVQVPDGFDTKPKYTKDKMNKDFDLYTEPKLSISVFDEKILLVWDADTKENTHVIVDAQTGELIYESPNTIID
jgi:hypothetical protein